MPTFKGHNELKLCKADMIQAVQHWLNTVVLREPVSVVDVKENGQSGDWTFSVKVKAAETPPDQPAAPGGV